MNAQLRALAVAGVVVLAAACVEMIRSQVARRRAIGATSTPASEPYVLYFTGEGCTVCFHFPR